jgi:hypothetical protein
MGMCKDKYVAFLNDLGFNVIRLPRTGIDPLHLIGRQNGVTTLLGGLPKLVTGSTKPLPPVTQNLKAVNINGKETDALDVGLGIHLLGSFLGAMGGKLGLKASYSKARTLTFSFNDVTLDRVLVLDVGEYLKGASVDSDNVVLKEYVLGNGDLFLVTDIIRSSSLTVSGEAKTGGALELEVPEIQQMVGGTINVKGDATSAKQITYQGPEPLAFGFICVHVGVEGGLLSVMSHKPTEATSLSLRVPSSAGSSVLLSAPGLLQLTT